MTKLTGLCCTRSMRVRKPNLNVVQPKLFQATRQDDLRFSDCTVSVIQILDDADAAFRILGAGLRTVLSVTTMFADKPHHLNGRTSAQRFCVLTILPRLPHSRLGYPRMPSMSVPAGSATLTSRPPSFAV